MHSLYCAVQSWSFAFFHCPPSVVHVYKAKRRQEAGTRKQEAASLAVNKTEAKQQGPVTARRVVVRTQQRILGLLSGHHSMGWNIGACELGQSDATLLCSESKRTALFVACVGSCTVAHTTMRVRPLEEPSSAEAFSSAAKRQWSQDPGQAASEGGAAASPEGRAPPARARY